MTGVHEHQDFARDLFEIGPELPIGEQGDQRLSQVGFIGQILLLAEAVVQAVASKEEDCHIVPRGTVLQPLEAKKDGVFRPWLSVSTLTSTFP